MADKGLNCFNNILHALKAGDGYIFSKSVKTLPETEKTWVLLENDYVDVKNKKGEVLYRIKECVDDFSYSYTDNAGHRKTLKLTEKRIVTFNPKLAEKQKYEINRQVEKAKISGHVKQRNRNTETVPSMLPLFLLIRKGQKRLEKSRSR
ncbi:MAG: hypothetical protein ACLUUG_12660 [Lachnospiraceae bacterium]